MKTLTQITAALVLPVFLSVGSMQAQVDFPAPSPLCKIEQKVGLTDITLEYSRPGVKDRDIFGSLVPFGEIWRTGANASTKLTFSTDVKLAGNLVPKGTYALYTIPNEKEWTIIIHKNIEHWGVGGDDYKAEEDLIRFNVAPTYVKKRTESMHIYLDDLRNNSATLNIAWHEVLVTIPVEIGTDAAVMKEMEAALSGPDGRMYYSSARFLFDTKQNLDKALEYVNMAIDQKDYKRFWSLRLKSQIQAALGDYKGAIASAEMSLSMATEEGNEDYVRMNQKSIEKWNSMIKQ